jgi:hypothetical protein
MSLFYLRHCCKCSSLFAWVAARLLHKSPGYAPELFSLRQPLVPSGRCWIRTSGLCRAKALHAARDRYALFLYDKYIAPACRAGALSPPFLSSPPIQMTTRRSRWKRRSGTENRGVIPSEEVYPNLLVLSLTSIKYPYQERRQRDGSEATEAAIQQKRRAVARHRGNCVSCGPPGMGD